MTLVLLLFTFTFTFLPTPAFAQDSTGSAFPSSNLQPQNPSSNLQLPTSILPTSPLYTDLIVNNMFHTFSCLMIGGSLIGQPCLTYQVQKNAEGALQTVPMLSRVNLSGGALGATTSLIGALYANPPLRTADYIGSIGEQLGFVKTAHAQVLGSGEQVLHPILALWQVSRNIAYVAMIVVFLIIGLMVLFRNRINPQTVITAQAALPGLVIGLILITFSYFLAALISDTAFIGTNLVGYYFSAAQGRANDPQDLVKALTNKNVLSIFTPFTKVVGSGDVAGALDSIWDLLADPNRTLSPLDLDPQRVITYLAMFLVTQIVLPFGGLVPGLGQALIAGGTLTLTGLLPKEIVSLSLAFIAMAILIYAMFRLLLRLISAFLTIIFLTVTAPFQFLAAALPGRQSIATGWILNMLANILIFPAILAVFYFIAYIVGADNTINNNCNAAPNCVLRITSSSTLTGKAAFPLFGGLDLNFINILLAFGALMALPAIPDIIVRTVGRLSQAGQLIGQEISGSVREGRGYAGQLGQAPQALAGQVGRFTDEPGWILNKSGEWQRITQGVKGVDADILARSGVRPGLATRIRSRFGF